MNNSLKVSVVMSVYNGELYLREAIESVLNQTFNDFEFIIVNDGSTDKSIEIINSYTDSRIVIVNQKNTGLSKALNNGIAIAKGEYIARMDADDISLPDRFEKQIGFLDSHPECVIVGSNAMLIDMYGEFLFTSKVSLDWNEIKNVLPYSPFFHSSVIFRKEIFSQCGGYFEKIKQDFEDRILWNRMSKFGDLRNLEDPLLQYRIVPNGISNRNKKDAFVLNSICNKIIETGDITNEEYSIINNINKNRTNKNKLANYYLRIGKIFIEQNFNKKKALLNLCRSISLNPFQKLAWFNLFLVLFPKALIIKWKRSRGIAL
ncbi:MAG: glycosyltransferase [Paludibacter sp.]|nr:glycosyltransferase [Paludibacter sp.]